MATVVVSGATCVPAIDLMTRALRLAGILAEGETPGANMTATALAVLNDILENWTTQELAVYASELQTFPLQAGKGSYTIGPGGDFNGTRPVRIASAYTTYQGLDYPCEQVNEDQFSNIALKTQGSQMAVQFFYDAAYPLGTVKMWPVPTLANTFSIVNELQLERLTTTAQMICYPPGYAKALRYELAVELAGEYGVPLPQTVMDVAKKSKADIKRANQRPAYATFDDAYLGDAPQTLPNFIAGF